MYKCCNYEHCRQEFGDKETRDRHEIFCQVPPKPEPPEPRPADRDERAS